MAMNDNDMLSDAELEALFQSAQDFAPMPSQALWEKVHQDALTALPEPRKIPITTAQTVQEAGIIAGLIAAIGGWISVAGLATATLVGLTIGFANPEALSDSTFAGLLPGFSLTDSFDLEDIEPGFSGLTAILEEG